ALLLPSPPRGEWSKLRGRAVSAEGAQDLVKVGGDANLVVQEILQPEIIPPLSQGYQGEHIAQTDPHRRLLRLGGGGVGRRGINAEMRSHSLPPCSRAAAGAGRRPRRDVRPYPALQRRPVAVRHSRAS